MKDAVQKKLDFHPDWIQYHPLFLGSRLWNIAEE